MRASLTNGLAKSGLGRRGREFLARAEFGDWLLAFYFVVFARQWFWPAGNAAAWCLTIPLALAAWFLYVSTKRPQEVRPGRPFWLIVGLPLAFVYLIRAPFPDGSFDVWSLRLFHGERGLAGFIYLPGEFFPTSAPFNPTPDMLTGIFRHILGYRLGTIVNLLALLWAATILDALLRERVRGARLRAACVLLCLWAEHVLFEINNYMPDLLALPLLLEATRLALDAREWEGRGRATVRVAFLVGASVALKLSNAAVALPLVMLCAWRALARRPFRLRELAADSAASVAVFASLLLPFAVWVYGVTGSPAFPLYNKIFGSPFYPLSNGWDGRWGGYGAREILPWPLLIFFEPQRTAELSVYSGRLSLAFAVALACVVFLRRLAGRERALVFIVILGSLLWSLTMGYIRYGLYLEVLSGVLLVSVASSLARADGVGVAPRRHTALAASVLALMVAQSALASLYVSREEWSMRPTVFREPAAYAREARYLLRDRSIRDWLAERERELFGRVDVWVVSGSKTAGLLPLLNGRAPVVGVRSAGIFTMEASRAEFARALARFEGRRMYSLALPGDFGEALHSLRNAGLEAGRVERVTIPFHAPSNVVYAYLFEVTRAAGASRPARTQARAPLPPDAFGADISLQEAPLSAPPGGELTLFFLVRNAGAAAWPSLPGDGGRYGLALRGRWLDAPGARAGAEVRAELPYDLPPGESATMLLVVRAPAEAGEHVLDIDMMQESVGAFSERGSKALTVKIRVGP